MNSPTLDSLWLPALFGAVGAIANCILLEGGFASPRKVLKDANKIVFDLGFIGTIFLGAIAALATYLLGTSELPISRQLGISLIVGVGGGNVLTSLVQKYEAQVLKLQIDELQASLEEAMGAKR